jgi:hypothetical protein
MRGKKKEEAHSELQEYLIKDVEYLSGELAQMQQYAEKMAVEELVLTKKLEQVKAKVARATSAVEVTHTMLKQVKAKLEECNKTAQS